MLLRIKSLIVSVVLVFALPVPGHTGEIEELEAKLDAIKAKRQAAASSYQAAVAQIENAQIKDALLALEEKSLAAKLGELKEKAKPALAPQEKKK